MKEFNELMSGWGGLLIGVLFIAGVSALVSKITDGANNLENRKKK